MFGRFFRSQPARPPVANVPEGTRVYAVGDIHGRLDLLDELQGLIAGDGAEYSGRRRVLIYVGDYIDRGYESRQTIDRLIDSPLPGFETVHLLGNHERAMLDFLEDISVGPSWLRYGGLETLHSYGVEWNRNDYDDDEGLRRIQAALAAKLPDRHRRFLSGLPLTHVEGDYLFVHAGIRPGLPIEHQDEQDLLWIRDEFLHSSVDHGKVIVHGHSIREEPELRANRVGIDTGAFATGRLTCLVLEANHLAFLRTGR